MKTKEQLLLEPILKNSYDISSSKIVGIYAFGSITYGTQTETSDSDYVVIVDMIEDYIQYESIDIDIHIVSINHYKALLDKHDIMSLEVYFNPYPIMKFEIDFTIDLIKLRHSISSVVSNSWVKAKKKCILENEDSWIGVKSCFHAIRILDFGIQIAKYGKIVSYTNTTPLWFDILKMVDNDVNMIDIMNYYKPQQNANATIFKKLAPKK